MDSLKKKRFLWGRLLAWAPWLPTTIGLGFVFRGIAAEKATGLAAVAGGLTETFLLFGLLAAVVFEVTAIILLASAFASGHWLRSSFSVVSLLLSGLMLFLVGVFLWLSWVRPSQPR